jgi:hypothetical protein
VREVNVTCETKEFLAFITYHRADEPGDHNKELYTRERRLPQPL